MRARGLRFAVRTMAALAVVSVATNAFALIPYLQGYETDTANWLTSTSPYAGAWYGSVTQVASGGGYYGVASQTGSYHAEMLPGPANSYGYGLSTGPYNKHGGNTSVFPGTFAISESFYAANSITEGLSYQEEFWWNQSVNDITSSYINEHSQRMKKVDATSDWIISSFPCTGCPGGTSTSGIAGNQWLTAIEIVRKAYDGFVRFDLYWRDGSSIIQETTSGPTTIANSSIGGDRTGWMAIFDNVSTIQTNGIAIDNTRTRVALPGDTDVDWDVDLADLSVLASNYANTTTLERGYRQGDFDETGFVDLSDLSSLASNWAVVQASGSASEGGLSAVPEPATMLLLGAGGLLLLGRRRRGC